MTTSIKRNYIKLTMAEKELSQTKLAELTGLSRQSISTIITRGTCSLVNAGKLARGLGISVADLMEESK